MKRSLLTLSAVFLFQTSVFAQMRMPAFAGGVPGLAHMQAISMQRHQARTLLYREALEELRKNPAAADVGECPPGPRPAGLLCLQPPAVTEAPLVEASIKPIDNKAPVAEEHAAPLALPKSSGVSIASIHPASPPTQAEAITVGVPAPKPPAPQIRQKVALLFGNNEYKLPIPALETPIADVEKISGVLKDRFGYETQVVKNATKAQIIEALNRIASNTSEDDSVVLFYAGHGYLMDDTNMGFWIPTDASVKTAANWVSNKDISKLLAAIRARQLILVSDSCFSGSLTREQKIDYKGAPKPEEILRKRSVLVFSSGGDEPVSDEGKEGHSIFAWSLIKTLDSLNGVIAGSEVWKIVRGQVTKDYPQEPQYGAVLSAGHHEGGEYLFQQR